MSGIAWPASPILVYLLHVSTVHSQKHRLHGRQTEYEEQIRKLRLELQEDTYKDADVKYRDKMIALRVRLPSETISVSCPIH